MNFVRWLRFTWDLKTLPADAPVLEPQYHIRPAEQDEEKAVRHLIETAFALDPDWGNAFGQIQEKLEAHLDAIFGEKKPHCLVITHGTRIIAASALAVDPEAETHLVSGPCILTEYRSRGLGSALLYRSLELLREAGLEFARGVTKENIAAGKFIYTKFGSSHIECHSEPEMVAA